MPALHPFLLLPPPPPNQPHLTAQIGTRDQTSNCLTSVMELCARVLCFMEQGVRGRRAWEGGTGVYSWGWRTVVGSGCFRMKKIAKHITSEKNG
jgi:hypothetical protein